jgi:hypothetical protein
MADGLLADRTRDTGRRRYARRRSRLRVSRSGPAPTSGRLPSSGIAAGVIRREGDDDGQVVPLPDIVQRAGALGMQIGKKG